MPDSAHLHTSAHVCRIARQDILVSEHYVANVGSECAWGWSGAGACAVHIKNEVSLIQARPPCPSFTVMILFSFEHND